MCAKFKLQLADRKENREAGIAGTLFNFLSCISFLETASTDSLDTQIVMAENAMSVLWSLHPYNCNQLVHIRARVSLLKLAN